MPEGHTLHRLSNKHQRWFAKSTVSVSSPQATFPGSAEVDGRVLVRSEAYGKHLFHHYETGMSVHVHLGLFGKFFVHDAPGPAPRETVRMRIIGSRPSADGPGDQPSPKVVDLVGATACELLTPDEVTAITDRLGPDPLRRGADPDQAWAALQRRSIGIGRALMDQKVLAGVGNVFRAELLFVHGIHPDVPSKSVSRETWQAMWDTLVPWLKYGVQSGRIVTTDPVEIGRQRGRMSDEERTYAYKQDHCKRCGTQIRRWDLAGRWAYACESCQLPAQVS